MKRHISLILLVLLCLTPVSVRYWIQETYGAECGLACRATTWYTEESFTSSEPEKSGCSEYSYTCSDDTVGQLVRANLAVLGASTTAVVATPFCSDATHTSQNPSTAVRLCEDMESTTACYTGGEEYCRVTWVRNGGTADFTISPIVGTHSVEIDYSESAEEKLYKYAGATNTTMGAFFKAKIVALPATSWNARKMAIIATTADACVLQTYGNGKIRAHNGTLGGTATNQALTEGNEYYFWMWYDDDDGAGDADGICYVCFSTTTTRPTTPATDADYCSIITTSAITYDVDRIIFTNGLVSSEFNEFIVDNIVLSNSELGSNP